MSKAIGYNSVALNSNSKVIMQLPIFIDGIWITKESEFESTIRKLRRLKKDSIANNIKLNHITNLIL